MQGGTGLAGVFKPGQKHQNRHVGGRAVQRPVQPRLQGDRGEAPNVNGCGGHGVWARHGLLTLQVEPVKTLVRAQRHGKQAGALGADPAELTNNS